MKKYILLFLCLSGATIGAVNQLEDLAARIQEREVALQGLQEQLKNVQAGSSDARQLRNKINQTEEFIATGRKEIEKRGGNIAHGTPVASSDVAAPSSSSVGRLSPEQGGFTDEYYDAIERAAEASVQDTTQPVMPATPVVESVVEEVNEDIIPAVIPPAPELPAAVEHKAPVAGSFLDDIIARGKEALGSVPAAAPVVEEVKEEGVTVVIPPAPALPEQKQTKSGLDLARERIEARRNGPEEDVEPEAVATDSATGQAALLEEIRKGVVLRKTEQNADTAVVPPAPELPVAPKTPAEELKRKFEEGGVRLRSRAEQVPLKEKPDDATPHSQLMDEIRARAGKPSGTAITSEKSIEAANRAEAAALEAEKVNSSKADALYQAINVTEQAISKLEARLAGRLETKTNSEKFGLTEQIDKLIEQDQQKVADLKEKLQELNNKLEQLK